RATSRCTPGTCQPACRQRPSRYRDRPASAEHPTHRGRRQQCARDLAGVQFGHGLLGRRRIPDGADLSGWPAAAPGAGRQGGLRGGGPTVSWCRPDGLPECGGYPGSPAGGCAGAAGGCGGGARRQPDALPLSTAIASRLHRRIRAARRRAGLPAGADDTRAGRGQSFRRHRGAVSGARGWLVAQRGTEYTMITKTREHTRKNALSHVCCLTAASLVIAVASLTGCSSATPDASAQASSPQNVTLTAAQRTSIHLLTVAPVTYHTSITTTAVVDFDHDRSTPLLAPFSGPVTRVMANLGDRVAAGQALATVNSPDFTTAVGAYRKAVITASAADEVAANDRFLYAHQAISQRENADAQATAVGADADRTAALQGLIALHVDPKTFAALRAGKPLALGQGVIRAPIAGTVVEKSIAPGQTLVAGTSPCFTIADTATMWVMAQVFGADVARVHIGDSATVSTGNGGAPLTGTVTNIGAVVDPDTRSVTARV